MDSQPTAEDKARAVVRKLRLTPVPLTPDDERVWEDFSKPPEFVKGFLTYFCEQLCKDLSPHAHKVLTDSPCASGGGSYLDARRGYSQSGDKSKWEKEYIRRSIVGNLYREVQDFALQLEEQAPVPGDYFEELAKDNDANRPTEKDLIAYAKMAVSFFEKYPAQPASTSAPEADPPKPAEAKTAPAEKTPDAGSNKSRISASQTAKSQPPLPPTRVELRMDGAAVRIEWENADGNEYEMYLDRTTDIRDPQKWEQLAVLPPVNRAALEDPNVKGGATYYYQIRGIRSSFTHGPHAITVPLSAPPASIWTYAAPAETLEPREDYESAARATPDDFKVIAGRVRGKDHKKKATYSDDSFAVEVSGPWTILAVADGGGSYRFARVGSRAACDGAVRHLVQALKDHRIEARAGPDTEETRAEFFRTSDALRVEAELKTAMKEAYSRVKHASSEAYNNLDYFKANLMRFCGENPAIDPSFIEQLHAKLDDFNTTLLVAVHTQIQIGNQPVSLVMTCSVGDGMMAAIEPDGRCVLLMDPDSGAQGGETHFLAPNYVDPARLRVKATFKRLKAVLLMTDGVADDYMPFDPGMSRLYADLVLNRIVARPETPPDDEIVSKLKSSGAAVQSIENFKRLRMDVPVFRILSGGQKAVRIAALSELAKHLGLQPEDVAASCLLAAARGHLPGPEAPVESPEGPDPGQRLVQWLDAYTIRGSFDDRTLLIMTNEETA